jgi:hypothetical protein
LLQNFAVADPQARRCAIWLTPATLQKAQELADFVGVDVDDFVDHVVNELYAHEQREGAMRARASEAGRQTADVIPMREDQRRRRPRG